MPRLCNIARRGPRRIGAPASHAGLRLSAGVAVCAALATSPARAEVCDKADGADAFVCFVLLVAAVSFAALLRHRAAPGQGRCAVIAIGWALVCGLFAVAIAIDLALSDDVFVRAARLEGCRAIWSDVLMMAALACACAALFVLAMRRLVMARRLRPMKT